MHIQEHPWTAVALLATWTHVKLFVLAGVQGITRIRERRFVKPEDAKYFGKEAPPATEEHPRVTRAQGAIDNELENLPTFALALVAHAAIGGSPQWALALTTLFLIARTVHSAAYVRPTQPLRNRAYVAGQLATLTLLARTAIELATP